MIFHVYFGSWIPLCTLLCISHWDNRVNGHPFCEWPSLRDRYFPCCDQAWSNLLQYLCCGTGQNQNFSLFKTFLCLLSTQFTLQSSRQSKLKCTYILKQNRASKGDHSGWVGYSCRLIFIMSAGKKVLWDEIPNIEALLYHLASLAANSGRLCICICEMSRKFYYRIVWKKKRLWLQSLQTNLIWPELILLRIGIVMLIAAF